TLTDYAIFALTLFYALVAASIFIYRRAEPDAERPYRTWGYPWWPILFLIVSVALIIQTIVNTPRQSAIGLFLISLGVPVYWLLDGRSRGASDRENISRKGAKFTQSRKVRVISSCGFASFFASLRETF